jgi:hypothetical protein
MHKIWEGYAHLFARCVRSAHHLHLRFPNTCLRQDCAKNTEVAGLTHTLPHARSTTDEGRSKAVEVSLLHVPPASTSTWAWLSANKHHRSFDSLQTLQRACGLCAHTVTAHPCREHAGNHHNPAGYTHDRHDGCSESKAAACNYGHAQAHVSSHDDYLGDATGQRAPGQVLIVARHGLSVANVQRDVFRGPCGPHYVDAPLTPQGRRQAEALGEMLACVHADVVVCSPLRRAMQTCL